MNEMKYVIAFAVYVFIVYCVIRFLAVCADRKDE